MIESFVIRFKALPIKQLIRFGIVGVLSNLAGYLIYLLITSLGVAPKLTVSLLFPIGTVLNFFGNRKWTFEAQAVTLNAVLKHGLVFGIGYLINIIILVIFVDNFHLPHQLVQIGAIFAVALYIFIAMKFFVFAVPDND